MKKVTNNSFFLNSELIDTVHSEILNKSFKLFKTEIIYTDSNIKNGICFFIMDEFENCFHFDTMNELDEMIKNLENLFLKIQKKNFFILLKNSSFVRFLGSSEHCLEIFNENFKVKAALGFENGKFFVSKDEIEIVSFSIKSFEKNIHLNYINLIEIYINKIYLSSF